MNQEQIEILRQLDVLADLIRNSEALRVSPHKKASNWMPFLFLTLLFDFWFKEGFSPILFCTDRLLQLEWRKMLILLIR